MTGERANANLNQRILAALRNRPMRTQELAVELNEEPRKVYSRCRRLETLGSIESDLAITKRLLYCVDDGKVVTAENYDECREQDHELRLFPIKERLWRLIQSGENS